MPWTGRDALLDVLCQIQPTPYAWIERIKIVRASEPAYGGYLPPAEEDEDEFERQNIEAGHNKFGADEFILILWEID